MITFDRVEISDNRQSIFLMVSLADPNPNARLSLLKVNNIETFMPTLPNVDPLLSIPLSGITSTITISATDIGDSIEGNMLFLTVIATETTEEAEKTRTIIDLYTIYKGIMCKIREIENRCEVPKIFIDSFLRIEAIDICLKTGAYNKAIEYWNKFFKDRKLW